MSGVASKIETIVRCVERARFEYTAADKTFKENFTRQDAAILNILRGCEAATDMANMLIRERRLGLPTEMRDSFLLLERGGLLPVDLSDRLQKMIGFRNIAVHQYKKLDLDIVVGIIEKGLDDLLLFAETIRPNFSGAE